MKFKHEQHCNAFWIGFRFNSIQQLDYDSIEFNQIHWMEFQFNWIQICIEMQVNWIQIKLKRNGIQIGGKSIENLLLNVVLKICKFKKTPFHASSLEKWAKEIPILNYPIYEDDLWNLKLSYLSTIESLPLEYLSHYVPILLRIGPPITIQWCVNNILEEINALNAMKLSLNLCTRFFLMFWKVA